MQSRDETLGILGHLGLVESDHLIYHVVALKLKSAYRFPNQFALGFDIFSSPPSVADLQQIVRYQIHPPSVLSD